MYAYFPVWNIICIFNAINIAGESTSQSTKSITSIKSMHVFKAEKLKKQLNLQILKLSRYGRTIGKHTRTDDLF